MLDKNKKSLEVEALENRVAPMLVSAPAPEPAPEPGGGGSFPEPIGTPQLPKHDNPGWIRKVQDPV